MTEATLKSALVRALRTLPNAVVFRHEDRFTHGIPDISITLHHATTWLEVKFANPSFNSRGIQELTLLRLALVGTARYVIYHQDGTEAKTYIVHPYDIGKRLDTLPHTSGFDHASVVEFVKTTHRKDP